MIIGIGGISRSGKSFLAQEMRAFFESKKRTVNILNQDNFVLPEKQIPMVQDHIDWEIPASVNWGKLKQMFKSAVDQYDIVIVEGLLAFSDSALVELYDYTIYITLDYNTFVERKRVDLRWGKEPEWYIEYIWEAHQKHGRPQFAVDLTLDGSTDFALNKILEVLADGGTADGGTSQN